ncbi:desulfoferrodoxin FeS4 iron-binding domain-containing protein [bacterium]|nr:desulfoferrodoxin FeS4 iron-binding domain-containing protein [bacterium]MBO5447283.1 desulfoferrodoxin FeS4 iron-binding domain-containing protein [bacterium]
MTERLDLYKCNVCGNLIEVVLSGVGELVCCGKPMEYLEPKTQDSELGEKHVPVFVATDNQGLEVRVGSSLHPMVEEHYIQFIETISDSKNKITRQYFSPQDSPIMVLKEKFGLEKALEFCNVHGLWKNNII